MRGAADFYRLAVDLESAPVKMLGPLRAAFDESGVQTVAAWAAIARVTAGKHGRLYPDSITHETRFTLGGNVEVEVGPDRTKPQGGMGRGFEFGSKNQPPHLDGRKATEAVDLALRKSAGDVIGKVIP